MTVRMPPRLATWLLQHLGPRYRNDSLVGDLCEEYQLNRTRGWYWRQVIMAVYVGWTTVARRVLIKRLMGLFAVTALGAGTLAWASGTSHVPQHPAHPSRPAVTAWIHLYPLHVDGN